MIINRKRFGVKPEESEWQQTPAPVQNYLDQVTYTFLDQNVYSEADYTTSEIKTYTAQGTGLRPIGKEITFSNSGILEQGGYRKSVQAGANMLYNAVPKIKTPYYLITDAGIKNTGTICPTKALRQIQVNACNVRDLGGWACDGGSVKYGKLFRGGEVTNPLDLDVLLYQLGIRAELELQGTAGSEVRVLSDAVDYCCPENGENWALYTLKYKEQMREAFRFIFESVKHNKPIYLHCTYGADRTGTIACIIESLLGVSRSDIDKDWELTSFYAERNRSDASYGKLWRGLLKEISDISGTTWNEKIANYIASLGFTAEEINDFRSEMIDGNPSTLSPNISTLSVVNNLAHVTNDNPSTTATEYQPYQATVTPDNGYAISSVQILMDGVDITKDVFNGEDTNLYRSVERTLSHCILNNNNTSVIDGQSYAAEVTTDEGYAFGTVQITMDGIDITDQVWISKEGI